MPCSGIHNVIPAFNQFETIDPDLKLEIKHLQKIIQEFDFILESVSKIKDGKVVEHLQPTRKPLTVGPSRNISSSEKSTVVGSDQDLIQLKDQLTGSSSHLEVISIAGMGGIGKTTLATNLYNDSLIEYHFVIRAWATVSQDYNCQEILRDLLKYNYLPHHLKACFLYMGVFPEDEEIFVSRLIKLWVAEGFLKPHSSKILEEVGEEYLKDLTDRNLIMVHKRDHHGEIKTCIIHDLLRDLCVKKAQEERFLLVLNHNGLDFPEVGYNEYRVIFQKKYYLNDLQYYLNNLHSHSSRMGKHDSRVRSIFLYSSYFILSSFVRLKLLKVLDALGIGIYKFPVEILELVNLRYLAFTYGFTDYLPAAIVKLQNLQTLILSPDALQSIGGPLRIPSEIWEMQQLRHLCFKNALLPYPSGSRLDREKSFDMVHLYTLSEVVNFPCRKEVFQIMPNLKKLGISYVFDKPS